MSDALRSTAYPGKYLDRHFSLSLLTLKPQSMQSTTHPKMSSQTVAPHWPHPQWVSDLYVWPTHQLTTDLCESRSPSQVPCGRRRRRGPSRAAAQTRGGPTTTRSTDRPCLTRRDLVTNQQYVPDDRSRGASSRPTRPRKHTPAETRPSMRRGPVRPAERASKAAPGQ